MKNEAKEPTEDGFYYVKNKFGVVQHIADQCEERSCTCISGCRLDDLIIQEHWLLDTYVRTMKKSSRKDSGCQVHWINLFFNIKSSFMRTNQHDPYDLDQAIANAMERMSSWTDQELVSAFNRETSIIAWTTSRQVHLLALFKSFQKRGIDTQVIETPSGFSFKRKVEMEVQNGHRFLKVHTDLRRKFPN